jgi:hypothetical protein
MSSRKNKAGPAVLDDLDLSVESLFGGAEARRSALRRLTLSRRMPSIYSLTAGPVDPVSKCYIMVAVTVANASD